MTVLQYKQATADSDSNAEAARRMPEYDKCARIASMGMERLDAKRTLNLGQEEMRKNQDFA